jgi:hypothetical protein
MAESRIGVTIIVKDDGSAVIEQFARKVKSAGEEVEQSAEEMKRKYDNAMKTIALASSIAFAGITTSIGLSIKAYADEESALNRLRTAVELTGKSFKSVEPRIMAFLAANQASTRFADDEQMVALQKLTTLTGSLDKAIQGTTLAMNLATMQGDSLEGAVRAVAMGMEGNLSLLARYIPALREEALAEAGVSTTAEKAAYFIKIMNEQFGGYAQRDLESFSGQMIQLSNYFSDLTEAVGSAFINNQRFSDGILPIIVGLTQWVNANQEIVQTVGLVAAGITGLTVVITGLYFIIPKIIAGFNALKVAVLGLQASLGPAGWVTLGISALSLALIPLIGNIKNAGAEFLKMQKIVASGELAKLEENPQIPLSEWTDISGKKHIEYLKVLPEVTKKAAEGNKDFTKSIEDLNAEMEKGSIPLPGQPFKIMTMTDLISEYAKILNAEKDILEKTPEGYIIERAIPYPVKTLNKTKTIEDGKKSGQWFTQGFQNALQSAAMMTAMDPIFEAWDVRGKSFAERFVKAFTEALAAALLAKGIEKILSLIFLEKGGEVKAMQTGGPVTGFSGIDRVPVMATSGEYVMTRQATELWRPSLEAMNRGQNPNFGGGNITINVNTHNLDSNSVKRILVPIIQDLRWKGYKI